jgi:anti-anti-sigma factor
VSEIPVGKATDAEDCTSVVSSDASVVSQPPAETDDGSLVTYDGETLRFRGVIDIYQAPKLQRELLAIVAESPAHLVVDVSQLEWIDAAAAQVLLAFRREMTCAQVVSPPDQVRERLERVGVWQQL